MGDGADLQTSTTLLRRLGRDPTDQSAWDDFVDRYGSLIFLWCRRWGLREEEAEDVCQNVLLDLARQMRGFVYDPSGSFRAWLKTVAHRSWSRYLDDRRRAGLAAGAVLERLGSEEAGEDFLRQLEAESDRELMEMAMDRVRSRVHPRTWAAFLLTAVEERSGAEAAGQLGMKPGAVFVARSKVQKMLRDEIRRLDGPEGG
jgi:RNA polymerase sigma factor (sigma-70 family)